MQFTSATAAAILASFAIACPLKARQAGTWTIQSFTRTCDDTANACHYDYAVNVNDGTPATGCTYDVGGTETVSARQQPYSLSCGDFAIGSSWSGQFGPDQGFQTLSVIRNGLIIYPAYKDTELRDGVTVTPDKSYTAQSTAFAKNVKVSK